MNPITFAIIGGDLRQLSLAELLARDGHTVRVFGLERLAKLIRNPAVRVCIDLRQALEGAHCIVGPLPLCDDALKVNTPFSSEQITIAELFDAADPTILFTAGKISNVVKEIADIRGITLFDYLNREEFAILNAIPTTEGAIQIAMEELPITLDGARCLVVGYGRIGKLLALRLKSLGAFVSVSARKCSDSAWIRAYGYIPLNTSLLSGHLKNFDVIFNTVDKQIFGKNELSELSENTLCIDLASKPGGIDLNAARELSVKVIWALSLPGKVAPVTSGAIVRETVNNILRENGILTDN